MVRSKRHSAIPPGAAFVAEMAERFTLPPDTSQACYDGGMNRVIPSARVVKTAVSLPAETFELGEKLRRKTGASRSGLYAAALRAYADRLLVREAEKRYVAGYEAQPEDPAFADGALKDWVRTQRKERW